MRIMYINLWEYGAMRQLSDAHVALLSERHSVKYVTNYDSDICSVTRIHLTFFPWDLRNFWSLVGLARNIMRWKPDVVHVNSGHPILSLLYPLIGRYRGIITIHDPYVHRGERFLKRLFHRPHLYAATTLMRHIVVPSEYSRSLLTRFVRRVPITVIPLYFGHLAPMRESAPRGHKPFRLLFFGRLLAYKGIDVLVDAISRLPHDEYELIIAGEGPAVPPTIPGNIRVIARYVDNSEMSKLFEWTDAVVLPYREGTQSGIVPFAVSFGKPVIASMVGNMDEEYDKGRVAVLVRPGVASELSAAIVRLREKSQYDAAIERIRQSSVDEGSGILNKLERVYRGESV